MLPSKLIKNKVLFTITAWQEAKDFLWEKEVWEGWDLFIFINPDTSVRQTDTERHNDKNKAAAETE